VKEEAKKKKVTAEKKADNVTKEEENADTKAEDNE